MLKPEPRMCWSIWRMNAMPNVSRSDIKSLVRYLSDAAQVYDQMRGQRYVCRAEMIRRQVAKLNKKLCQDE